MNRKHTLGTATAKFAAFALAAAASLTLEAKGPKYAFIFIGDGMSVPQRMIADEFVRKTTGETLAMNHMPYTATTRTASANSLITDSAAAATAIACGEKTNNGCSGVDPKGQPLESCADVAKKAGRKVGIVSTVTITHATPAGFYAHRKSRGDTAGIAEDLANSGFDLLAGGGLDVDEKKTGAYARAAAKGYSIITNKADFLALKPGSGKILTKFTNGALENAIDKDSERAANQPTIAEIVTKAIELLDNDNGFFLMCEGGRIDWAGHANDAATNLRDVIALDEAVQVALTFQQKHPDDTLIVVTGDHETGGMAMGFAGTGYSIYMDRLAHQTMSVGRFEGRVSKLFREAKKDLAFEDVQPLVTEAFGFAFDGDGKDPMKLTAAERAELEKAFAHDVAFHKSKIEENSKYDGEKRYLFGGACRLVMSHKAGIGWSSGAHTAMPVLTTAKGVGAEAFSGFIENTGISKAFKALYR